MGRVQHFEIRLSNSRVIYSPGEPLTGTVILRLAGALPYKGTLNAGEHSFPFQFLLPASAPSSFEGPFGKVIHQVRAVIDTPRFSKDYKCSKVFYILAALNLNEIPGIEQPNVVSTTKKFSYKLVKTGNLTLSVTSDLKGYIVGQVINLHTDIMNKSGKDTAAVVASLIQKVAYKSKRSIYDLRTIAEVEGSAVKAWKHAEWKEQILVPALPQSLLQGCSLINIDYYIQVSIKNPDVVVTLPIYIGNIAVNREHLNPSSSVTENPSMLVPSAPPADEDTASGYHPMDNISIPTKCHSQQQHSPFSYAPGLSFQGNQTEPDSSGSPNHPTLCLSTGATVPYYAEGAVVPLSTAGSLILPPEYSTWGYPYEAPPSYEQSCSSANSSISNGN
uniref:Arrestin domain-containing protein 1 isoform X2 n=1 Tax=Geotrypetes seraphini TaxID=260995 RepID=A0A6P8SDR7_GEOSA|nr:arrestin domain-containing protein 1 isoform X2 [Geotrypetes seraphini]